MTRTHTSMDQYRSHEVIKPAAIGDYKRRKKTLNLNFHLTKPAKSNE